MKRFCAAPASKILLFQNRPSICQVQTTIALSIIAVFCPLHAFGQSVSGVLLDPPVASQTNAPSQPGQLPNTVSAPPFTVADKFDYRIVQSFGLRSFVGSSFGALVGLGRDSPHEWGQGVAGFAQRYGSGFAGNLSRQTFAFVLETALHEDPRYFPAEKGSGTQNRILNSLKQIVWAKNDDGSSSLAYARIGSEFGAAEFTNVWQPPSTGKQSNAMIRAFIGLAADGGYNAMQEFLPFTRPSSLRHRH